MKNALEVAAGAARGPWGWAEVRTANHATRYQRFGAGAGTPVVILLPASAEANVWPELFDSLSTQRRVYLPDLPDSSECFSPRMRSFLDGVGLFNVTLVAPASFCIPALEFALLDPDRITRLILVPTGAADETGLTGALSTTVQSKAVPVLVVRRDVAVSKAVQMVCEFVAES